MFREGSADACQGFDGLVGGLVVEAVISICLFELVAIKEVCE